MTQRRAQGFLQQLLEGIQCHTSKDRVQAMATFTRPPAKESEGERSFSSSPRLNGAPRGAMSLQLLRAFLFREPRGGKEGTGISPSHRSVRDVRFVVSRDGCQHLEDPFVAV